MAPRLRCSGPSGDVAVERSRGHLGIRHQGAPAGACRAPREERDDPRRADRIEFLLLEPAVPAAVRPVISGTAPIERRQLLAHELLEVAQGIHVEGGLGAGELAADPRSPVGTARPHHRTTGWRAHGKPPPHPRCRRRADSGAGERGADGHRQRDEHKCPPRAPRRTRIGSPCRDGHPSRL